MAIQAPYEFNGITIPQAYIRVQRLYGGKYDEGWSAVLFVYANKQAAHPEEGGEVLTPVTTYNVSIPYSMAAHPYELIYEEAMSRLPGATLE